jgi:hypothetical protein
MSAFARHLYAGGGYQLDTHLVPQPLDWVGDSIVFSASLGSTRNIWQIHISPRTFAVSGVPRRLTMGTETESQASLRGGRHLVFSAELSNVNLWQVPLDSAGMAHGEPRPLTQDIASNQLMTISGDGRRLAVISTRLGSPDVWLIDLDTGKQTPLTTTADDEEDTPVISRDGARVLYFTNSRTAAASRVSAAAVDGGVLDTICEDCGSPTDWSEDGRWVLLQRYGTDQSIHVLDRRERQESSVLKDDDYGIYRGHLSPDERWMVFHAARLDGGTQDFIAPFDGLRAAPRQGWIPVNDGQSLTEAPRWSPDGNRIYYISDRDGSRCIWAQRLEPASKKARGEPVAILHLHSRQRSMTGVSVGWIDLAVARDKLIFNIVERRGNVWAADLGGVTAP